MNAKWTPRDIPEILMWQAEDYRPGKPWKPRRSYSLLRRWMRRHLYGRRW